MSENFINQKHIYKLVDEIASKKYQDEEHLLSKLVDGLIKNKELEITGGRVWKFDKKNLIYQLNYQAGKVKKIEEGAKLDIYEEEVSILLDELASSRTLLKKETSQEMINQGIELYSMSGVGFVYKIKSNKYYEYILGFSAEEFTQSFEDLLTIVGSVASSALKNLYNIAKDKKIRRDYLQAKQIQDNILPEHSTEYLDYKIFGVCVPDSDIGGDYFDYIRNNDHKDDEETLSIVISDASSKGLPAAIQALFVSGALRMGMSFATRISHIFALLNNLIYKTFPFERFVTLFMCELTRSKNRMILYANAGHCSPILYKVNKDSFVELEPTGGLVGIMEHQKFGIENTKMRKGDILVLFTDGINEAINENQEVFGEERIKEIIKANKNKTPKEIAYILLEKVEKYSALSDYNDDKTIIVIKRDELISNN